jgi:hypothetical protein
MPYPESFDVFDGMPTAYQHYNRLRADALRFGQSEANAANVGDLLARYSCGMNLVLLQPKRLRVEASAAAPVSLMIGGYPLAVTANVDLPAGSAPSGPAAEFFVFAVRSTGQTGFSLDVNTTPVETSTRRIIGRCYYDGSVIVPESIRTEEQEAQRGALLGAAAPMAGGRLTLSSGNPTADVSSGNTLYYAPYTSDRLSVFVPGLGWRVHDNLVEPALPLDGLTSGNYDIFGDIPGHAQELRLSAVKWLTDSARNVPIVRQNGVWVRNNAPQQRYLGTIRLLSTATCADSPEQRLVWNAYNRVPRALQKRYAVNTWTYNLQVWRAANNDASLKVECVVGLDGWIDLCVSSAMGVTNTSGGFIGLARNGIGQPDVLDPSALVGYAYSTTTVINRTQVIGRNFGPLAAGYYSYTWVEYSQAGTITLYGATTSSQYGINGLVMG